MRAVLTFHSIDDLPGPLSYSPAGFEALLDALAEAKLPVLGLDELLAREAGAALPLDDGISTVLSNAIPRLDAHYLRWPALVRALPGKPAHAYIALRRALRLLRGH